MKIRSSERGVALIITLIMLSVVTVMAVLFLGVSRRERAAVTVTSDQITAKFMTEAAFARAQSDITSRMLTASNEFNYDFAVSTNFINVGGFVPSSFGFDSNNVSYAAQNGGVLDQFRQAVNIGNLQFDPRPPVYIQTNSNEALPLDFRFYLDFNRNGLFEPTGLLPEMTGDGRTLMENGAPLFSHVVGDPQWIGVLEYPNQPHSATNRFIGRYAFIVLPEGKSLDLNTIHNQIKQPAMRGGDYYARNQGIGPWEMNLGGFLSDLNFNVWGGPQGYIYQRPSSLAPNQGVAFNDAASILRHRTVNLAPASLASLATPNNSTLQRDFVDLFGNGPYLEAGNWLTNEFRDTRDQAYWGADLTGAFYDVQELFDGSKVSSEQLPDDSFVGRLRSSGSGTPQRLPSTYDRYTVYRLLSQLGVDSEVDESAKSMSLALLDGEPRLLETRVDKLHLNYDNINNDPTNFVEWNPRQLFLETASRMMAANMNTNPPNMRITNAVGQLVTIPGTNFFRMGETYVNRDFTVTNMQVWPRKPHHRHEYSANVHQILQVAANITDVVTTNNRPVARFATDTMQRFPIVFRPRFDRLSNGAIRIADFVEVTNNAVQQIGRPYRDLDNPMDRAQLQPDDNVMGIPWVIAAKKGLPNFNEFGVLSTLEVTRKLEINKTRPNAPRNLWRTNQMMVLSISNTFGLESWNSYTQSYPRPLQVRAYVESSVVVTNERGMNLFARRDPIGGSLENIPANTWSNGQFRLPIYTNYVPVASSAYNAELGRLVPVVLDNAVDLTGFFPDSGFPIGQIGVAMTNHVRCVMIDPDFNRIIDFVNLDELTSSYDLTREVIGDVAFSGQVSEMGRFWDPIRLDGSENPFVPTQGVMSQIVTSLGVEEISDQVWTSYVGRGAGRDKNQAIDLFRAFLGFPPLFLSPNELASAFTRLRDPRKSWVRQVPFTPSVRKAIYQSWQANDPLVHYTVEDLTDTQELVSRRRFITPGQVVPPRVLHNLGDPENGAPGRRNERYRPWQSIQGGDEFSYNVAYKDPLVRNPDDWQFPTNKFPGIGWLGRVHRGTPWQTMYLKGYVGALDNGRLLTVNDLNNPNVLRAPYDGVNYPFERLAVNLNTGNEVPDATDVNQVQPVDPLLGLDQEADAMTLALRTNWFRWAGSQGTHPTNDWKYLELFTTAVNDNASRGLLSVNQPGLAAWSAVLSGVTVQSNMNSLQVSLRDLDGVQPAEYVLRTIEPAGLAGVPGFDPSQSPLSQIVNGTNGINATRARFPGGRFRHLGDILATPALTVQSPFLEWNNDFVRQAGLDDFAMERIPQQVLSLLKADEPRVTIYAYGQALRPANQSLRSDVSPGRLFNICTNYQITGEFVSKRVVRFDGAVTNLTAVVESETIIPAD